MCIHFIVYTMCWNGSYTLVSISSCSRLFLIIILFLLSYYLHSAAVMLEYLTIDSVIFDLPLCSVNWANFSCSQFPDWNAIQLNDKVFPHLKISFHVNDWIRNSEIHFFMALIPYYEHVDKKRRVCSYLVFVIHFRNHAAFNTLSRT